MPVPTHKIAAGSSVYVGTFDPTAKIDVAPPKPRKGDILVLTPSVRYKKSNGSIEANINGIKYVKSVGEGLKYNCPHHYKSQKHTSVIDWFQISAELSESFDIAALGSTFQRGEYLWFCNPMGTKDYLHRYTVKRGNVNLYGVQISPRNSDNVRLCTIHVENHLYYDFKGWDEIRSFIYGCTSKIHHISRLDIAFDGLNYIKDLMDDWCKDYNLEYGVKLIGKSKINGYEYNKTTKKPDAYRIGTGVKIISIYNKSKRIRKEGKQYISDYWWANGLNVDKTNYRVEMRLYSGYFKDGIRVNGELVSPEYILDNIDNYTLQVSLFRMATVGLFEWVYMDDKNVTRCSRVNLFPLCNMHVMKIRAAAPIGTPYKAKMLIHQTYAHLCSEIVGKEEGIAIIKENLKQFNLHDWYRSTMRKYSRMYVANNGVIQTDLFALADDCPKPNAMLLMRARAMAFKNSKQKVLNNYLDGSAVLPFLPPKVKLHNIVFKNKKTK